MYSQTPFQTPCMLQKTSKVALPIELKTGRDLAKMLIIAACLGEAVEQCVRQKVVLPLLPPYWLPTG